MNEVARALGQGGFVEGTLGGEQVGSVLARLADLPKPDEFERAARVLQVALNVDLTGFRAARENAALVQKQMAEAMKPLTGLSNIVHFPRIPGLEPLLRPSSVAIIRPSTEDVIEIERGGLIRNKGGRPSHDRFHQHHIPRILELLAAGRGPWVVARMIIWEVRPPKGKGQVTDNPNDALAFGLVYCTGENETDSLYRFVKKIALEIPRFRTEIHLGK